MSTFATALRLSGLAAIALLAEPLTGLADTIAAGRLGVEEQASLALGASMATTATWLVAPIMFAQTTEIATLRATGRDAEAARTTRTALLSGGGFGLILGAILATVALFAGLTDGARDYLLARAVGLPLMAFAMAGYGALRGSKAVHTVSLIALSGAAVHIGLDVVSVVGTSLGLGGLGLASVAAQLMVAAVVGRTLARRGLLTVGSHRGSHPGSAWRQSVAAVLVLSVRAAVLGLSAVAMTASAVGIGPIAGAAHQVTYQFFIVAVLAVEGWKSAAQIMVSSASIPTERRRLERILLRSSIVLGVLAGVVMMAALSLVVGVMSADAAVADAAESIWPLGAVALAVGAVAFTRDGIEYGRASYGSNLVRILAGSAVWLTGAWITWRTGALVWMWWAMPVGLLVRSIWPYGGTASRRRRSARIPEPDRVQV